MDRETDDIVRAVVQQIEMRERRKISDTKDDDIGHGLPVLSVDVSRVFVQTVIGPKHEMAA